MQHIPPELFMESSEGGDSELLDSTVGVRVSLVLFLQRSPHLFQPQRQSRGRRNCSRSHLFSFPSLSESRCQNMSECLSNRLLQCSFCLPVLPPAGGA